MGRHWTGRAYSFWFWISGLIVNTKICVAGVLWFFDSFLTKLVRLLQAEVKDLAIFHSLQFGGLHAFMLSWFNCNQFDQLNGNEWILWLYNVIPLWMNVKQFTQGVSSCCSSVSMRRGSVGSSMLWTVVVSCRHQFVLADIHHSSSHHHSKLPSLILID